MVELNCWPPAATHPVTRFTKLVSSAAERREEKREGEGCWVGAEEGAAEILLLSYFEGYFFYI